MPNPHEDPPRVFPAKNSPGEDDAPPTLPAPSQNQDAAAPNTEVPETIPQVVPPAAMCGPALPLIPGYEVRAELARGGMGVVYAARDLSLGREVAVKLLLHNSPKAVNRFATEAKVTANLAHPGIPPVHELGTLPDGMPFLAMKLIRGRTLANELIARSSPAADLPRFVQIFEQLCQAIGFAHSRGVIHRDIKPLNIMVGQFGEVQVMDWGLARKDEGDTRKEEATPESRPRVDSFFIEHDATSRTAAGSVMGTPAYMSPEQAKGEWTAVDSRADVFALGAVLCDILTGKPAYTGTAERMIWLRACEAELSDAYARLDTCGAEPDLVALARHCLNPRPEDRPPNGKAVADAVAAYRAGVEDRLQAAERQRAVAEARTVEQRKRRRVQLALASAVALLVLGGGAAAWWFDKQADERKREQAEADTKQARLEADQARTAGELNAAQAKADAESRAQQEQARIRVRALLELSAELRKTYRFRDARGLLETAGREADSSGVAELNSLANQAKTDLAFVMKLDEIRLTKFRPENGKWSVQRSQTRFRECFQEFGFDILKGDPDNLAKRLRESPIRDHLIDALDQWGLEDQDPDTRRRIWELTTAATGQQWRTLVLGARDRTETTDAVLAKIPREELTPSLIGSLGLYLYTSGGNGLRVLEEGLLRFPGDFWLHYYLATTYNFTPGRQMDSLGHLQCALAIRPTDALLWAELGNRLGERGDHQGREKAHAIAHAIDPKFPVKGTTVSLFDALGDVTPDDIIQLTETLIRANPKFGPAHAAQALAKLHKGDLAGAEAASLEALRLDAKLFAPIHYEIGLAWDKKRDTDAALRCYRELIRLAPAFPLSHDAAGLILVNRNDPNAAILAFQEAVRLDPTNGITRGHLADALIRVGRYTEAVLVARDAARLLPTDVTIKMTLGSALFFSTDTAGSIAVFREASELAPKNAALHDWLSYALLQTGDAAGALAAAEEAVKLEPKVAQFQRNLGQARIAVGDKDGGFAALRLAVDLAPEAPDFQRALGQSLVGEGRFAEALPYLKKWNTLLVKMPGAPDVAGEWVRDCEAVVRAESRLPDVLAGKVQPTNAAERIALGRVCLLAKKRYHDAVRFFREAFEQDKKLVGEPTNLLRYNAARAAAFATTGEGMAPAVADDRARHRQEAYEWLKADFELIKFRIALSRLNPVTHGHILMKQWLTEPAFARLRHPFFLTALPPEEAKRWRTLWDDIRQLRDKCDPRPPTAPPPREVQNARG